MPTEIIALPLHLQIAAAGGFLAYITAYSGFRQGHTTLDSTLTILVFGVFSALPFLVIAEELEQVLPNHQWQARAAAALPALLIAVLAGALWRKWGRSAWYWIVHGLGVHRDDGLGTGWESLIQTPGMNVTQIMVRTTDGTELFCRDAIDYQNQPECGLKLGSDGSVMMVVDAEKLPSPSRHWT